MATFDVAKVSDDSTGKLHQSDDASRDTEWIHVQSQFGLIVGELIQKEEMALSYSRIDPARNNLKEAMKKLVVSPKEPAASPASFSTPLSPV